MQKLEEQEERRDGGEQESRRAHQENMYLL